MYIRKVAAAAVLTAFAGGAHAITVTSSTDATALANAIAGSGITISNATLSLATSTAAGTFSGGAGSVGFGEGIVLTTGTVDCVPGPNDSDSCYETGTTGTTTTLAFDFTSTTGEVFFQYVFGSEEYNEYVGSQFNDTFQLLLNGTNIALVPGGGGIVSINNVNCGSNSAYYINNSDLLGSSCANQGLDIQYDGLTKVLTATGSTLAGVNHFEFTISDLGDDILDSGVFIKAGSFSGTNPSVPEPSTLALFGLGLLGLGFSRWRKHA